MKKKYMAKVERKTVSVNMPPALYRELKRLAGVHNRSVTGEVVEVLEFVLMGKEGNDFYARVKQRNEGF